jgi:hypothetical protein
VQRRLLVAAVLLVLGTLLATTGATAGVSEGGASSPSDRGLAKGHVKKLPKLVQKWQGARFAAADAVTGSGLRIDILGVSADKTTYRVHLFKAQ